MASLPPDNIKTKLQRMKKDANGQFPYKGISDCFLKVPEYIKIDNLKRRSYWIMGWITSILY